MKVSLPAKLLLAGLTAAIALSACSLFPKTPSDKQVSTQVSGLLTALPTNPVAFAASQTALASEIALSATPTPEPTREADLPTSTLTASPTLPPVLTASGTATNTLPPSPTVTQTISPDEPLVKLGPATGTDTLENETDWQWGIDANAYTKVSFGNGTMTIVGLKKATGWRLPKVDSSPNMYIEAIFNSGNCHAKDSYGIMFRVPDTEAANQGYMFTIACDGTWRLWKYDGAVALGKNVVVLVDWQENKHVLKGANQTNRIGVWTQGDQFYFYANGVLLNKDLKVSNDTYTHGGFGVFILPNSTIPYSMSLLEMSYWKDAKR